MENAIKQIYRYAEEKKIRMTDHAIKRCLMRDIDIITDILPTLLNCEIIEEYPNDYPYKSYLVSGTTENKKPLHVVCADGDTELWIITAYFPDTKEWENDFKTRKKV